MDNFNCEILHDVHFSIIPENSLYEEQIKNYNRTVSEIVENNLNQYKKLYTNLVFTTYVEKEYIQWDVTLLFKNNNVDKKKISVSEQEKFNNQSIEYISKKIDTLQESLPCIRCDIIYNNVNPQILDNLDVEFKLTCIFGILKDFRIEYKDGNEENKDGNEENKDGNEENKDEN